MTDARELRFGDGAAPVHAWHHGRLSAEVLLALERLARSEDVARVAVMPDVHLAEDVCVGVVVGTRAQLYPQAVGGDIGCGMAAMRFDVPAAVVDRAVAARLLGGLARAIPPLRRARAGDVRLPLERELSHPSLEKLARREGQSEHGTLGRGNHFIELQADDEGALWVMLHSGSRALGPAIRDHHLRDASRTTTGLSAIAADSDDGRAYASDVEWAIAWAESSRLRMLESVSEVVHAATAGSPIPSTVITCHHNHLKQETHGGERLWVHRKGACYAGAGVPAVIPGSMGTLSVHVEGRGCEASLTSSSHGAGRTLSRTEARRQIGERRLMREMQGVWFDHRKSHVLRDEAPGAYKDLREVLRAQRDLTRIVRTLRPVLVYKGT